MSYKKIASLVLFTSVIGYGGYCYWSPNQKKINESPTERRCCSNKTACSNQITNTTTAPRAVAAVAITDETKPKGCVFRTLFKEESAAGFLSYKTPKNVQSSIEKGLAWVLKAQNKNGGWGAGLNTMQHIRDPHAVKTDPATTSMISMALLRCGSTLEKGEYADQLVKATNYLLEEIEANKKSEFITDKLGTQIQTKLGQNIDAVITAQYFSNLLSKTSKNHKLVTPIKKALDICVEKIQNTQDAKGRTAGGSWAGVLQSSMANSALEAAEVTGAKVDQKKLKAAKNYQASNYDYKTGTANTDDGAGIMLYSMSSSVRASAKDARKVREKLEEAQEKGLIDEEEEVTVETLEKIGYDKTEALELNASYNVYNSAKKEAQTDRVMNGFGNNGGEEFISFLQTGESMVVNKDDTWKTWYDNVSAKMLAIQNADGSWNGHHCITSPSFCTATCLLILSIHNDTELLMTMGEEK